MSVEDYIASRLEELDLIGGEKELEHDNTHRFFPDSSSLVAGMIESISF